MNGILSDNDEYRSSMNLNGCDNTETNQLNDQSFNNIQKNCSNCLDNTQIKGNKCTIDSDYNPWLMHIEQIVDGLLSHSITNEKAKN